MTIDFSGGPVVTVWFDYPCPHCHIGLQRLDVLSQELAFTIDRRPYLLRPNAPLNDVLDRTRQADATLPAHDSDSLRPPLKSPGDNAGPEPFSSRSLSTVLVHEVTACAREQGKDRDFYLEAAGEYWRRCTDLGNIFTLRRSAITAGLDWGDVWPKLESGYYRPWVMAEHWAAVDRGVPGVPSYLIGGRMLTGDIGLDELRSAIQNAQGT